MTYKLAFSMFSLKTLFCCGKIEPVSSKVNSVVSHCFSTGSFSSSLSAPFALQSHTQLLCVLIYIFLKIFLLRHRQNNPPLPKKRSWKWRQTTSQALTKAQPSANSKLSTKHHCSTVTGWRLMWKQHNCRKPPRKWGKRGGSFLNSIYRKLNKSLLLNNYLWSLQTNQTLFGPIPWQKDTHKNEIIIRKTMDI